MSPQLRRFVDISRWMCLALVAVEGTASAGPTATKTPLPAIAAAPSQDGSAYQQYVDAYWKRQADYYAAETGFNRTFFQQRARQTILNADAFAWQETSGPLILGVVIVVVVGGVLLSAVQVTKSFLLPQRFARAPGRPQPLNSDPNTDKMTEREPMNEIEAADRPSSFKATMQGVEFSSASIGLMMLVVSLAFFFLYLKFVYTITPVGS